jgi:hypothetical protein
MNTRQGLAALLLTLLLLPLVGCDAHASDKEEISAVFQQLDDCNRASDGKNVVEVFTKSSFEHNEQMLKAGLDGTPEQVRALPPTDMLEVLRMRLLATREELEKLDGRGYVRFATGKGWYASAAAELPDQRLTRFKFSADGREAHAQAVFRGDRTGTRIHFIHEDGAWRYDEALAMREFDRGYRAAAHDEGMKLDQFILSELENETGKEVPNTIWQPMRGKQDDDKPPPPPLG